MHYERTKSHLLLEVFGGVVLSICCVSESDAEWPMYVLDLEAHRRAADDEGMIADGSDSEETPDLYDPEGPALLWSGLVRADAPVSTELLPQRVRDRILDRAFREYPRHLTVNALGEVWDDARVHMLEAMAGSTRSLRARCCRCGREGDPFADGGTTRWERRRDSWTCCDAAEKESPGRGTRKSAPRPSSAGSEAPRKRRRGAPSGGK